MPTDIADPASVAALFEKVKEKYGHADVLVNNAGVFKAIAPVKDVDQQAWWDEMVCFPSPSLQPHLHLTTPPDPQHPRHLPHHTVFPLLTPHAHHPRKNHNPHHWRRIRSLPHALRILALKARSLPTHDVRRSREPEHCGRCAAPGYRGHGYGGRYVQEVCAGYAGAGGWGGGVAC